MKFHERREESLDNEIRDYIDRETQDNIAAGMPPEEARQAALRKFGPVLNVKEDTRAVWGWIWFERLAQDIRIGCRMLRRNPGFTLVAVVSLAIGIGVNSAMFSFADALLLRPLPVLRPSEVVTVGTDSAGGFLADRLSFVSYPDYLNFRNQSKSFAGLVAFDLAIFGFSPHPDALPHMKMGMLVTGNFFRVMGVEPELGRGFRPDEDQVPGRDAVVVLGHDFWEQELAGDGSIIGRRVRLNGTEFTVIGVAPERFTGMHQFIRPAFFVPVMMWNRIAVNPGANLLEARDQRAFVVKGRLKPGVTLAQAQAELAVIAKALERSYPETNRNHGVAVRTEVEARFKQAAESARLIGMLMALAAVVLLVACANIASLLLSRARVRGREVAVRLAIGAGRLRLIRQLLTESLLIALAGGAMGLVVAYGGIVFFRQLEIPSDLPIKFFIELDGRMLLASLAISFASALLFGLVPAIQTTRADLLTALKNAGADRSRGRRLWGRNLLVVGQVAASLVLLAVATLMYRGFRHDLLASPGFRKDHLMMMRFDPTLVRYSPDQTQQFFRQLVERVRRAPGVKSAALTEAVPMDSTSVWDGAATILPEGFPFPRGTDGAHVMENTVDEGYFDTLRVPIVRGRGFRSSDKSDAPRVAVINETLASHYWPHQDPVGKRFRMDNRNGPWVEIVGVAKNGKYMFISEPPLEYVYFPLAQHPKVQMTLLAESSGDASELAAPLREVVRALDANQPIYDVRTMEELFRIRAVRTPNLITQTVAAMGLMGLVLSMVGLYGLVAYAASRRTREIGIRMAMGAHRTAVLRMVMRQGMLLALSGIAVGLVASYQAERLLNSIFVGGGTDAVSYWLVAAALLAVTAFAAYIPARRAARVDPMLALRYE
jgi:predicted permease